MNTTYLDELKELLNDPRTGLRASSDTNKTYYAILDLFDKVALQTKEELRGVVEGMLWKDDGQVAGFDKENAQAFYNHNKALDDVLAALTSPTE